MGCDEFDDRLQELLDRREDPASDRRLVRHASECAGCQQSLADWLRICRALETPARLDHGVDCEPIAAADHRRPISAQAFPAAAFPSAALPPARSPVLSPPRLWQTWSVAAALVFAAVMFNGVGRVSDGQRHRVRVVDSTATPPHVDLHQLGSQVNQPQWWGAVVRAAWEPVDPLAEGFRPLTNSLQTALELLTPRARTDTPLSSPSIEDANVRIAVDYSRLV